MATLVVIIFKETKAEVCPRKSFAQVETLVRPQVVRPKSCELKLRGRSRPYRLMGRFSEAEKGTVIVKAKAAGLSVNEYIRASILGRDYQPPFDKQFRQALLMVYRELTAWGNNINQIAKGMNSGTTTPAQAGITIERMKEGLQEALRLAHKVLARGVQGPMP
jgi:hypothetical protein